MLPITILMITRLSEWYPTCLRNSFEINEGLKTKKSYHKRRDRTSMFTNHKRLERTRPVKVVVPSRFELLTFSFGG